MKSAPHYIHVKIKILADFLICISIPLITFDYTKFVSSILQKKGYTSCFNRGINKIKKTNFENLHFTKRNLTLWWEI